MTSSRISAIIVTGALVTLISWSCSGDKATEPDRTPPKHYATLEWVSTAVLFRDTPGKKDHSLLFVLASWCGWCRKLKAETLTDSTVIQVLGESFNIAQIDPDSDSLVVYRDTTVSGRDLSHAVYQVSGYPATIILDRLGNETGRISGYLPPDRFASTLNSIRSGAQ